VTSDFASRIRGSLEAGDVAVYESSRGRKTVLYQPDGGWYRLRVGNSPYLSTETRIGVRALRAAVEEHYPVRTMNRRELHPAVRARIESGTDEAVVATWLMDARLLADRLRAGGGDRDEARKMISAGHRLEERVAEEPAERIRERVEEIAEALPYEG